MPEKNFIRKNIQKAVYGDLLPTKKLREQLDYYKEQGDDRSLSGIAS